MTAIITEQDTLESALQKINDEINKLRSYGVRREELPSKSKAVRCTWSNGSAEWYCGKARGATICPGGSPELKAILKEMEEAAALCGRMDEVQHAEWRIKLDKMWDMMIAEKIKCHSATSKVQCLDANEFAISGMTVSMAQALQFMFNNLPLYGGSFEAKERGVFNLKGIDIPPPIKKSRLDDLDALTIKALVEKASEES